MPFLGTVSDRDGQDHDGAPAITKRGRPSGSFLEFDLVPLLPFRAKNTRGRDATNGDWTNNLADVGL